MPLRLKLREGPAPRDTSAAAASGGGGRGGGGVTPTPPSLSASEFLEEQRKKLEEFSVSEV